MAMAISSIINLGSCATVGFSRRGLQEQANPNQLSSLVQADDARNNGRQECIIQSVPMRRREALVSLTTCLAAALVASGLEGTSAFAVSLPKEEAPKLCDSACEKELENLPMMTTGSGLQYKDIKVGNGPTPPIGYQVAANYVAMVPSGDIFDSSLTKGLPYIFRVGSGQVIKGLDEGILSMKVGGKRRLYIPGQLAFPKGLSAAAGRPRVPPSSPVVFDVSLEYIPGFDDSED